MSLSRLNDPAPHASLLSNGRYSVLITGAGTGYSRWNGYALTGWCGDRTEDADGIFVYLRDLDRGIVWSIGHQPLGGAVAGYDVSCRAGQMCIERLSHGIGQRIDICVAPDDDVEIRRLRLHNTTDQPRRIELTSYAEVVLDDPAAHAAHPAFAKLFVQTEYVAAVEALLARRRPRSAAEHHPWMVHMLAGEGALQYETDRARFVGRGRTLGWPLALTCSAALSGTTGNVLDPIFSLRRVVELAAGQRAQLSLLLAVANCRDTALELIARYADPVRLDAAFDRAAAHERAALSTLGITEARAAYFQDLAGAMLYGHPALRAGGEIISRSRGQWSAVGPPLPAVLQRRGLSNQGLLAVVQLDRATQLPVLRELLQAQTYWDTKGVHTDLLIVCGNTLDDDARRVMTELEAVHRLVLGRERSSVVQRRGDIPPAELDIICAAAHVVVSESLPVLVPTLDTAPAEMGPTTNERRVKGSPPYQGGVRGGFEVARQQPPPGPLLGKEGAIGAQRVHLLFDNGHGGFTADGSEYVMHLETNGERPPMPWVNIVANETFGFLVSESGAGCTWSRNSRENRLTPWYNDPIADPYGEAFYLRDEDAAVFWSPLPGPAADSAPYEVRHGFGYTQWRHTSADLEQEAVQFVPRHDSVKITRLRLTNTSKHPRRISVFCYHRLVLGVLPTESGRSVVTEIDDDVQAIVARNPLNNEFSDAVVFAAAVAPTPVRFTGDRTAFIGRNGSPSAPAALRGAADLDGHTGAALDPCAALQLTMTIAPGQTAECAVLFGETTDTARARALIDRYRRVDAVDSALHAVREFWTRTLSAVQVHTPSPALDVMINGWLLYQVLSCRLWGRSAFYQSGGAFGFRDQLQDAAALIYTRPDLTRAQILLHAAHQFAEGDVLHWWHPPTSRGIRTHFSDDLLWLPYVTAFYVRTTGDWSVLDEPAGFVTARMLEPDEVEAYLYPAASDEVADVYAHCCRALDRSLTRGAHGLPLMGTGDWNDGMNRVGREGRGESVWLGFFLCRILEDFIPICVRRGDAERAQRYRAYQAELKTALNEAGWDGHWYRRAYYDDGTPLGSAQNDECRIDAIAQAWAVISKVAPPERAVQAMQAVERQLLASDAGLIRLLTPPFDRDPHDPGYIKGYVPGIRENGGQYTHAALWVVQAFAELGRRDRAAALLEMLGPVYHARTPQEVAIYQVEPYVVAADIYGVTPHLGRGGWTWYTGSAGWMYRVAVESVLGVCVEAGDTLLIRPCIPDTSPSFRMQLRLLDGETRYEIEVRNPTGKAGAVTSASIDGHAAVVEAGTARLSLVKDGRLHHVVVTLAGE
jgi:cellobiose phosphorylase